MDYNRQISFTSKHIQNNVRYVLAKKKSKELFAKWVAEKNTDELILGLIKDIKSKNNERILNLPSPQFVENRSSIMTNSRGSNRNTPQTPPRPLNLTQSVIVNTSSKKQIERELIPEKILQKTEIKAEDFEKRRTAIKVPRFYFAESPPVSENLIKDDLTTIREHFYGDKRRLGPKELRPLCTNLLQIPIYFAEIIIERAGFKGEIEQATFVELYKSRFLHMSSEKRAFWLLDRGGKGYLTVEDFWPLLQAILDIHPGLEFLKQTPEFQEKYASTVVQRIMFELDWDDDGRIPFRDFKHSKLFATLTRLETEEDINLIRDFFIYEHFYVIYCKFYELDLDHDEYISKEDFGKYNRHAVSTKMVSRIWSQETRKFTSDKPGYMNYNDFLFFLLVEEDKTHPRSIQYWFKLVDLDCNGIITGYEMEYFYDEMKQRLKFLNEDLVFFEDFLCQMNDAFQKESSIIYTLPELMAQPQDASVFFNFLSNLEKLVAFERKDAFSVASEKSDYPDFTEWDRFAMYEYKRLSSEDDENEESDVLDDNDLLDTDD